VADVVDGVAGDGDDEVAGDLGGEDAADFGRRNIVTAYVNTVSADGESDIGAGVDEQAGAGAANCMQGLAGEGFEFGGGQVALAELDVIDVGLGGFGDLVEELVTIGGFVVRELAAGGDVAKLHGCLDPSAA